MAIFELGVRSGATATGAAIAQIRTGGSYRTYIREIGIYVTAGTQAQIGLIRAASAGTASTSQAPTSDSGVDATVASLVETAWSAAPTIAGTPAYLRRATLAAQIGAGLVWAWGPQELWIPVSSGLLLWNFGAASNPALDIYFKLDE